MIRHDLVVSFKDMGYSGFAIYRLLKEKYNIQAELVKACSALYLYWGTTLMMSID